MSDEPLLVEAGSTDICLKLEQPEFADRWVFRANSDGCVNFGQIDPSTTSVDDGSGGDVRGWEHICDLSLMIEMLTEVRKRARVKWAGSEVWDD
jgi:hypothetical protein